MGGDRVTGGKSKKGEALKGKTGGWYQSFFYPYLKTEVNRGEEVENVERKG